MGGVVDNAACADITGWALTCGISRGASETVVSRSTEHTVVLFDGTDEGTVLARGTVTWRRYTLSAISACWATRSGRRIRRLWSTSASTAVEASVAEMVGSIYRGLSHLRTVVTSSASCASAGVIETRAAVESSSWACLSCASALRAEMSRLAWRGRRRTRVGAVSTGGARSATIGVLTLSVGPVGALGARHWVISSVRAVVTDWAVLDSVRWTTGCVGVSARRDLDGIDQASSREQSLHGASGDVQLLGCSLRTILLHGASMSAIRLCLLIWIDTDTSGIGGVKNASEWRE